MLCWCHHKFTWRNGKARALWWKVCVTECKEGGASQSNMERLLVNQIQSSKYEIWTYVRFCSSYRKRVYTLTFSGNDISLPKSICYLPLLVSGAKKQPIFLKPCLVILKLRTSLKIKTIWKSRLCMWTVSENKWTKEHIGLHNLEIVLFATTFSLFHLSWFSPKVGVPTWYTLVLLKLLALFLFPSCLYFLVK